MKLPGWVIDNKASVERESAEWRGRSDEDHAVALAAVCRASAKLLRARADRARVDEWTDPLPAHSVAALRRLRQRMQ